MADAARVRSYCDADHDAVVALWRRAFPGAPTRNDPVRDVARMRAFQPDLFLVAEAEGRVVGTARAGYDGHRGWLHRVAVEPGSRRRGVGRALVREAERRLAERYACPKLNLQIRGDAPEPQGFYERLGYGVESRISMGKQLPRAERARRAKEER